MANGNRAGRVAAVAGLTALLVAGAAGSAEAGAATPGALSVGDRLYPDLGNGGYDARSYDVSFDYRPEVTTMDASVTMRAVATQSMLRFSLDSAVRQVRSVLVDGRPAAFEVMGEKLVITPDRVLARGREFTVAIGYVADRSLSPASPAWKLPPGINNPFPVWQNTPDGFALLSQPDRAHVAFPSNDHPSDKATFTFRVTTPADVDAVASGTLTGKDRHGDRVTTVYRLAQPTPTDVVQIAVGRFTEVDQAGPHGLTVRSYVPDDRPDAAVGARRTLEQLAWLEGEIGRPFPYPTYGVLGVDSEYGGVALETATLPTFSAAFLHDPREAATQVHEMVHQYFGDTVAVRSWDDMWLSEGHAIYYQSLYQDHIGEKPFETGMKERYVDVNNQQLEQEGPVAHLNSASGVLSGSDNGGALTLYALRNLVGQNTFTRIEQTFYDTFRGRSASTQDYIAVAERVSGHDLAGFFQGWLYRATTPPMPGRPDWHAKPAPAN
jgi:aminopeptidase N